MVVVSVATVVVSVPPETGKSNNVRKYGYVYTLKARISQTRNEVKVVNHIQLLTHTIRETQACYDTIIARC